jgi:hypothetical protein
MSFYFIGIGGTGAKCLEAVTHLAAAGLLPEGKLYSMFIDPDSANGSLDRAKASLVEYRRCESKLKSDRSALFQTPIQVADPSVWSPFNQSTNLTLEDSIEYNSIRAREPNLAGLVDVLFSQEEKQSDLAVGFRGHPSIGAVVLADAVDLNNKEPWSTFHTLITQDAASGQQARIFICGSIFGGTGASGLLTIARLVKREIADIDDTQIRFGCSMLLPYFTFDSHGINQDGMKANASSFIPNTQSALKYYHQNGYSDVYDSIYVLGDRAQSQVETASIGGSSQRNEPHFIELFAGLAAIDFFQSHRPSGHPNRVAVLSRQNENSLEWNDLPYFDKEMLKPKITQMVKFAFAYLGVYEPAIISVQKDPNKAYIYPWLVDFLGDAKIQEALESVEAQELFQSLSNYAKYFLEWVGNIHTSAERLEIRLIRTDLFSLKENEHKKLILRPEFILEGFTSLDKGEFVEDSKGLHLLWEFMCNRKPKKSNRGLYPMIQALYEGCGLER